MDNDTKMVCKISAKMITFICKILNVIIRSESTFVNFLFENLMINYRLQI